MHRIFAMPWLLIGGLSALLLGGVPAVSPAQTCSPEVKPLIVLLNSTTRLQLASKKPIRTVLNPKESVLERMRTVERDLDHRPAGRHRAGHHPKARTSRTSPTATARPAERRRPGRRRPFLTSAAPLPCRAAWSNRSTIIPNGTNSVILTGYTNRGRGHRRSAPSGSGDEASASSPVPSFTVINGLRLNGVQQVQLDVVIARVERTKGRNFGFNFFLNGPGRRSSARRSATWRHSLSTSVGVPSSAAPPADAAFGQIHQRHRGRGVRTCSAAASSATARASSAFLESPGDRGRRQRSWPSRRLVPPRAARRPAASSTAVSRRSRCRPVSARSASSSRSSAPASTSCPSCWATAGFIWRWSPRSAPWTPTPASPSPGPRCPAGSPSASTRRSSWRAARPSSLAA